MDAFTDSDALKMGSSMVGAALAPATGGLSALLPIGASIISGIGNLFGTSSANKTQMEIAQKQMDWQTAENQKNRDFQQTMWNLQNEYNTPANQRKLLQEGNFNPFVQEFNGGNSSAGSVGTPSMVGAPNMPHIQPINPLGLSDALMQALSVANQKEQVDSSVDLNKANIIKVLAQTAFESYDKLGYKGYRDLMYKLSPILSSLSFEGSRSDIMFNEYLKNNLSARYNQDMDSLNKEVEYNLGKKYGEQRIQANLQKLQYDISEIVGRLATMNVQNESLIKQTAADLVVKGAHAFMLKQEGNKFAADAETANQLRQYLVKNLKHSAAIREIDEYFAQSKRDSQSDLIGFATSKEGREAIRESYRIPLIRNADALWTTVDRALSDYIKINSSGSAGSYGANVGYSGFENSNTQFGW